MIIRTGVRTGATCLLCQWRSFSVSSRRLADKTPTPAPPPPPRSSTSASTAAENTNGTPNGNDRGSKDAADAEPASPLANAPRAYGKKLKEFTPTPLSRPIGMNYPPSAGENTGIDNRSLKQRRDDFVNYEKHLKRRQYLTSHFSRPYFRDWRNMQFHKGKTFLAPPRLFKADLSLYFPNLHGRTLAASKADTTPLLEGRASVVSVFSSLWAENQVRTFVSREQNPALHAVLEEAGPKRAQLVRVNIEEDLLKAWMVRLFSWSLRRRIDKENWERYFMVRKGISDEIRESVGLLNSKVGYTYLVDHECRIRWAGSGNAEPEEREGLVKGLQRILIEMEKEGVDEGYVRKSIVKTGLAAAMKMATEADKV